jgi:hypothetical protein
VALSGLTDYVNRYGRFDPTEHFEDVPYSPDFPTVAQVISQLCPHYGVGSVNGVLAVDPFSLAALLQFTGPITVTGFPTLNSSNAAEILLRGQYTDPALVADEPNRHNLEQKALDTGLKTLAAGSVPPPRELKNAFLPLVSQGRLMFWSPVAAEEALSQRLGLAGSFPQSNGGDVFAVTVANAGNSKIDAYLHESATDAVSFDPRTGATSAQVKVHLFNAAPSSGLPSYVIGSFLGSGLKPGTSFMWLSFYSPLAVKSATFDGHPLLLTGPNTEVGVYAYSAFLTILSKSTGVLAINLEGRLAPGSYSMATRLQPLAVTPSLSVTVTPAGGRAGPETWTTTNAVVQEHRWTFGAKP